MNISYAGPGWYVVYTLPRAERRVQYAIEADGLSTYLPVERFEKRWRCRIVRHERPLFPRYLFIQIDADRGFPNLKGIDGFQMLLANNGQPSRLPAAWIEMLRKSEDYGVFDRTKNAPLPFKLGETVRLVEGAGVFAGLHGVVQEFIARLKSATAKKRVKILLDFLGRQSMLELDICDVEKV